MGQKHISQAPKRYTFAVHKGCRTHLPMTATLPLAEVSELVILPMSGIDASMPNYARDPECVWALHDTFTHLHISVPTLPPTQYPHTPSKRMLLN